MHTPRFAALFALVVLVGGCGDRAALTEPSLTPAFSVTEGWGVGEVAPDLTALTQYGAEVRLSDFRGGLLLVELTGIWCVPSRMLAADMAAIDGIREQLDELGMRFDFVTLLLQDNAGYSPTDVADAMGWYNAFYAANYPDQLVLYTGDQTRQSAWEDVAFFFGEPPNAGTMVFPTLILLGPDGTVLWSALGYADNYQVLIDEVLIPIAEQTGAIGDGGRPPVITDIVVPAEPVAVGVAVTVTGTFTDAHGPADGHTGTIDWGDGTVEALADAVDGAFASSAHAYAAPGLYQVTVAITDGAASDSETAAESVVVYDPSAGFVTGAGHVTSPAGACLDLVVCGTADAGPASLAFVSRYGKSGAAPSGTLTFHFRAGGLDLRSTAYDWLVVTGSHAAGYNARFKGSAMINGTGEFRFMVWAADNDEDTFRIRVWLEDAGIETTVYDSEVMPLERGAVVVHTGR